MTVKQAVERLKTRRSALLSERDRIKASRDAELDNVNQQIAAINTTLAGLDDAKQAAGLETLLAALGASGVTLVFTN